MMVAWHWGRRLLPPVILSDPALTGPRVNNDIGWLRQGQHGLVLLIPFRLFTVPIADGRLFRGL